jgi:hypothetical protein
MIGLSGVEGALEIGKKVLRSFGSSDHGTEMGVGVEVDLCWEVDVISVSNKGFLWVKGGWSDWDCWIGRCVREKGWGKRAF